MFILRILLIIAMIVNGTLALCEVESNTINEQLKAIISSHVLSQNQENKNEDAESVAANFDAQEVLESLEIPKQKEFSMRERGSTSLQQIWSSNMFISLPSNFYLFNKSDSLMAYASPSFDHLIGIARYSPASSLSIWMKIMQRNGYSTDYYMINNIQTAFGMYYDSKGWDVSFYFNDANYSYCLLVSNTTYEEAQFFIDNIANTLVRPSAKYDIFQTGATISLPFESFIYSSSDELVAWMCPHEYIMIGFTKYERNGLAEWRLKAIENGEDYPVFMDINGTDVMVSEFEDTEGYGGLSCFFNYGKYSYQILIVGIEDEHWSMVYYDVLSSLSVPEEQIKNPIPDYDYEVILPKNLKGVGERTFTFSDVFSVIINENCESIGERAFAYCDQLECVYIPETVTYIANDAFYGCDKVIIYSPDCCYAATYAAEHGIEWIETP